MRDVDIGTCLDIREKPAGADLAQGGEGLRVWEARDGHVVDGGGGIYACVWGG